jgi:hypothetical protein
MFITFRIKLPWVYKHQASSCNCYLKENRRNTKLPVNINNNNSMEEVDVESECKNCSHDISLHSPKCSKRDHDRLCGCSKPQYYGVMVSDTNMGWTEFHCNRCGNLIGFLNSIDENIYEIIEDEVLLCVKCIALKD